MNDGLIDAFRHSVWATRNLIEFCRRLTPEQLSRPVSGAYGSILETLKHILGAEAYYSFVLSSHLPEWKEWDDEPPSLSGMTRWAEEMAVFWEDLLRPLDVQQVLIREHDDGAVRTASAGIVLAQALHHANAHREQIAMILTSMGIEPPDLDVWVYGSSTGQHSLKRRANL